MLGLKVKWVKGSLKINTKRSTESERFSWWLPSSSLKTLKASFNTETEMLSFWWNFNHWLHRKLSFRQLSVQSMMKISSKWRHFCFSEHPQLRQRQSPLRPSCICVNDCRYLNPLRANFFRGNINIYLYFMSIPHIDMTQVLKILPQVRPGLTYST